MSNDADFCVNCPICGGHWHMVFFDLWHATEFLRGHLLYGHGVTTQVEKLSDTSEDKE